MRRILKKRINKKGQLGEFAEDLPAILVVIFILILILIFFVFLKKAQEIPSERSENKLLLDNLHFYLYSLLQENESQIQEGLIFSDILRTNSEDQLIKDKLYGGVTNICRQYQVNGCDVEIIRDYSFEECHNIFNKEISYVCFFIPSKEAIAVKVKIK